MKLTRAKRAVLGIVAAAGAVVAAGFLLVDKIPPQAITHMNMHMMKRRILRYAAAHDAVPQTVEELPHIEGFADDVADGWGRPIFWRIDGDEVSLISYGRDNKPGGSGEDAASCMPNLMRSKFARVTVATGRGGLGSSKANNTPTASSTARPAIAHRSFHLRMASPPLAPA
jgi:hypothetical protein